MSSVMLKDVDCQIIAGVSE